jgi:aminopeptidase N
VKADTWQEAVHGRSLSNQLLTATITGFSTVPGTLLEPYIEPYFECLRTVWDERSIEIAGRIVRGLYPLAQDAEPGSDPAGHPVVVRTDEWLEANSNAPRALRRIILEQRSHLLRALTAQAAVVRSPAR